MEGFVRSPGLVVVCARLEVRIKGAVAAVLRHGGQSDWVGDGVGVVAQEP